MPNIVVDTCVFIRLGGIYKDTYNCIMNSPDIMNYTKEIEKEYCGRETSSPLFQLMPFLRMLRHKGKLRKRNSSYVKSRVEHLENTKTFNYPTKARDRKFVKLTIATKSHYLISTDPHFLNLPANIYNGEQTEHVNPTRYNQLTTATNTP